MDRPFPKFRSPTTSGLQVDEARSAPHRDDMTVAGVPESVPIDPDRGSGLGEHHRKRLHRTAASHDRQSCSRTEAGEGVLTWSGSRIGMMADQSRKPLTRQGFANGTILFAPRTRPGYLTMEMQAEGSGWQEGMVPAFLARDGTTRYGQADDNDYKGSVRRTQANSAKGQESRPMSGLDRIFSRNVADR